MKGDDRYFGRDALYGSSALARKAETVILDFADQPGRRRERAAV